MDVNRTVNSRGFEELEVKSDKMVSRIFVKKVNNGYSSYEVNFETGPTPAVLKGWFTTPDKALAHITTYLNNKQDTKTAQRDKKYKRNHATAASKDNS